MSFSNTCRFVTLLAASTLVAMPLASAGKIVSFDWTDGIVSIAGIEPPFDLTINNDDVVDDSPNVMEVRQKDFRGVEHIDIVFEVMNTDGVTEYSFIEGVQNSSGFDWESYHIQLGFGTGADFVLSTPGDGLDFDAPLYNSTIQFDPAPGFSFPDVTIVSEDYIFADGGPGQPDTFYNEPFVFSIDVPDGIDTFTLRQFPIAVVPEPSVMILIALGGCAALADPALYLCRMTQ
ncbi:MAG: choice-of-anchor F family protein [Planctomycetota bacterium]